MIGDHLLPERFHCRAAALRFRQLASVDVDLVRRDHDRRDLRIGRCLSPGRRWNTRQGRRDADRSHLPHLHLLSPPTINVPFIPGCRVHTYGKRPAFSAVNRHSSPGWRSVEEKPPAVDATLCGNGSLFVHVTVAPTATVMSPGTNVVPSIDTDAPGVAESGVAGEFRSAGVNRGTRRTNDTICQISSGRCAPRNAGMPVQRTPF